ncbi:MAG: sulfotransferase [Gammaproteobacteria bacterium]|nr:sulfotransferase [Gammaproteobacteria bacterium]
MILALDPKTLSQINPVDFLIVGAQKSGTTTLFETLSKHPRIFIPQLKECKYFSCMAGNYVGPGATGGNKYIKSLEEYQGLFKKAKPGQLCGDVSPDYLYYYQNAVPKILDEINAQVPIIIVLRNPIDRAYSNYLMQVRERREELTFEDALESEAERISAHWVWDWCYVDIGLYAEQVKAYMDNFDRVLVLLFEEDIVTGQATNKILDFLNLESLPQSLSNVHANRSGYPKNWLLHRMTMGVLLDELIVRKVKNVIKMTPLFPGAKRIYGKIREMNLKKVDMAPQTRQMLKEKFQDDVDLLAEYTGLPVYEFWKDFQ